MGLIKRLFVLVLVLVAVYRIDVLERQVAETIYNYLKEY